jgi:predicted PurR-regulated permease PerM
LLSVLVIIALVVGLVVPAFVNALVQLAKTMPTLLDKLQAWLRDNETRYPEIKQVEQWISAQNINWEDTAKKLLSYISGNAGNWLGSTVTVVSGIAGGTVSVIMGFLFSLYILLDKEKLKNQTKRLLCALLPERAAQRLFFVAHLSTHTFAAFITGECLEAGMLGVLCWLGMLVLRLPYAAMVGALVGVTTLIPLIGGWIGTIVGALMIAVESIPQALIFIIFVSILHGIADNYIYPKIVGSSVGLSPLWVLVSVTLGGTMAGIAGMLFAVPVCSVLYSLARLWTQRRLAQKEAAASASASPPPPQ